MRITFLAGLSLVMSLCVSVRGDDTDAAKPEKPLFVLSVRQEKDPEYGLTIFKNVLQTDNYKVVFETPRNWRMIADENEQKIGFESTKRDTSAVMYFRILPSLDSTNIVELPKLDDLRQSVLNERSGSEVKEEFPCFVRGMKGQGFKLSYPGKGKFVEKVVWAASKMGLMEFDLKISGSPGLAESDFNSLVNSFTIEPIKKPVPKPL